MTDQQEPKKPHPDIAKRALEEAQARKLEAAKNPKAEMPKEYYGPKGKEPTRFDDWERKGIAYDF